MEVGQLESAEKRGCLALWIFNTAKTWMLPIVFIVAAMGAYMSSAQSEQAMGNAPRSQFETDPTKEQDFRELSIHPNGQDWLFDECSVELDPLGDCWALRYNVTSNRLQHYELPTGYVYLQSKFSPSGNYVLMTRLSKIKAKEEGSRQAFEQTDIAVMKADGTEFKVLPLAKGNKVAPIMSNDDTSIAYWRAALRPPGSKTLSSHFDVWEVNLLTGEDRLFAGPFSFFDRSGLQYLSQDTMLVGADGPREYAQDMSKYWKKYNRSSVYRIPHGTTTLPEPMLTEVVGASYPSSDRAGNIYFEGERPGLSLFRKSPEGTIEQWVEPHDKARLYSLVAAPDGSYIAFTYEIKGTRPADGKRGIGVLNTHTSEWKSVNIPPRQSSTPIMVKVTN